MTDAEHAAVLRHLLGVEEPFPPDAYAAIERAIELLDPREWSCWCEACGVTHRASS